MNEHDMNFRNTGKNGEKSKGKTKSMYTYKVVYIVIYNMQYDVIFYDSYIYKYM